jgi:hypothetical protein
VDRRAIANLLAAVGGGFAVEHGREEDRAALGVEVEHFGRIGREMEAVLLRPGGDSRPAALKHGDIECIDALLDEDLGLLGERVFSARACEGRKRYRRVRFAHQPLKRPRPTLFSVRRHAGKRNERPEFSTASARELERDDVVFFPVGVRGEGGGAPRFTAPLEPMSPAQASALLVLARSEVAPGASAATTANRGERMVLSFGAETPCSTKRRP